MSGDLVDAVAPVLTEQDRRRGQERALAARRQRAAIKADLREGRRALAEVLDLGRRDPVLGRMRAVDLVRALPGIGPARADHVLDVCHIAPGRRVAGLGDHQRAALVRVLSARRRPGAGQA